MRNYRERTQRIYEKTRKIEKRRKAIKQAILSTCGAVAAVAIGLYFFLPFKVATPDMAAYKDDPYYSVLCSINEVSIEARAPKYKNNYEKWKASFEHLSFGCNKGTDFKGNGNGGDMMDAPASEYVETTDNQVQGVIEGDLFKRTQSHIFYLSPRNRSIYVHTVAGEQSECIAYLNLGFAGTDYVNGENMEMYLSQDGTRLYVLASVSSTTGEYPYVALIAIDVSDPAHPTKVNALKFSGSMISSRLTEQGLLLINDFYFGQYYFDYGERESYLPYYGEEGSMQPISPEDIVCPENSDRFSYAVISLVDLDAFSVQDCTALFSFRGEIYVSENRIFTTRTFTENQVKAEVRKTEISSTYYKDGELAAEGSVIVDGSVKNQYSMDERAGILRVVTTNYETPYKGNVISTAGSLYCVDLTTFTVAGKVEKFITGETVESVRFDGDTAYVCTAVRVTLKDPVFAFDLSDVDNITYVDTGVIEGYSSSLIDFKDGYLLGVGYGGKGWSLKIEVFQKTETSVDSVCAYEEEYTSFSEEYKSYYIDREKGLFGLAVDGRGGIEYKLFAFNGYDLILIVDEVLSDNARDLSTVRATIIDGYLYVLSDGYSDVDYKIIKVE